MKKIALLMAMVLTITAVTPLWAEEDKGAEMVVDAFLLRPVGMLATAVGFCAFVISSPFAAIEDKNKEAFYWMVERPAHYTFSRPLGEFEGDY